MDYSCVKSGTALVVLCVSALGDASRPVRKSLVNPLGDKPHMAAQQEKRMELVRSAVTASLGLVPSVL